MVEARFFLRKIKGGVETPLSGEVSVGRSEASKIRLTEGAPSRNHALLSVREGVVYLKDWNSTNGTFVNGQRLDREQEVPLSANDRILFDLEEFTLRIEEPTPPPDKDRTAMRPAGPEPAAAPAVKPERAPAPLAAPPPPVAVPAPPPPVAAPSAPLPPAAASSPPQAASPPVPPLPPARESVKPVVADAAKPNVPPAWADISGSAAGGNKTVFKTLEQMEEERRRVRALVEHAVPDGPVSVPQLTILGHDAPLVVQLRAEDPANCEWTIGSEDGREILIKRDGVSALHAKIVHAGKVWKVVDQVSGNGTFVNGKRVTVSYLHSGDRIAFGPAECVFNAPDGKIRAPAAPASGATPGSGMDPRRKRALMIAVLSFLGTMIVLLVLKWFG